VSPNAKKRFGVYAKKCHVTHTERYPMDNEKMSYMLTAIITKVSQTCHKPFEWRQTTNLFLLREKKQE